jgi:hypothetical protein
LVATGCDRKSELIREDGRSRREAMGQHGGVIDTSAGAEQPFVCGATHQCAASARQ